MTSARSRAHVVEEVAPSVVRISRSESSGWCVDMTVVATNDGAIVYGPVHVGDNTRAVVERVGVPRLLVAPNHYHHLSLAKFRALWPDARVVAAPGALPRLAKQGHRDVEPLDDVRWPKSVRAIACAGTKNGECWLLHDNGTLIVGDAFFHVGEVRGLFGAVLRATRTAPGLNVGRTFGWLGVGDRKAYRAFATTTLRRERPRTIAFAHGAAIRGDDVAEKCAALVERHVRE